MIRRQWRLMAMVGVVIVGLSAGTTVTLGGQRDRDKDSDRDGAKKDNDTYLQQQIDALKQQIANLSGGTGIQDPVEPSLNVLRGTIGGSTVAPQVLAGSGFTVANPMTVFCGTNPYATYQVTFAPGTFSSVPSVVVSAHDFIGSPTDSGNNHPVYTVAIDDSTALGQVQGGITTNGFTARIKTDAFGITCYGSYNWDFIAIGPR